MRKKHKLKKLKLFHNLNHNNKNLWIKKCSKDILHTLRFFFLTQLYFSARYSRRKLHFARELVQAKHTHRNRMRGAES